MWLLWCLTGTLGELSTYVWINKVEWELVQCTHGAENSSRRKNKVGTDDIYIFFFHCWLAQCLPETRCLTNVLINWLIHFHHHLTLIYGLWAPSSSMKGLFWVFLWGFLGIGTMIGLWKSNRVISSLTGFVCVCFVFKILFIFREREREGERERNIDVREIHWLAASHTPPAGDLAHNPDMCPDWESSQ